MNARATALRTATAAMFVAFTLLVAYLPTVPGSALKFMGFPLLLGGLLIGPRTGFAVGCLTDVINFALHPTGFFFPGFTLTQGLTCTIPALLVYGADPLSGGPLDDKPPSALQRLLVQSKNPVLAYLRLLVIFAITKLITSVLLVSYFTSRVVGTPFTLELAHRAAIQAIHVPVYALLALVVLQGLAQTDLYPRLLKARR